MVFTLNEQERFDLCAVQLMTECNSVNWGSARMF